VKLKTGQKCIARPARLVTHNSKDHHVTVEDKGGVWSVIVDTESERTKDWVSGYRTLFVVKGNCKAEKLAYIVLTLLHEEGFVIIKGDIPDKFKKLVDELNGEELGNRQLVVTE